MSSPFMDRVGFMQGRLTPPVRGRIQCFPDQNWRRELMLAQGAGFSIMEWTLDSETWELNPLVSAPGRREIQAVLKETHVSVPSLTGDNFMERPFYKAEGVERQELLAELDLVLDACVEIGISMVLIPLVDNGRLASAEQEDRLIEDLWKRLPFLKGSGLRILFESDLPPARLKEFIANFPPGLFGVNYDIGNSASLAFNAHDEFEAYGERILNVHVKDRRSGGGTVPLGTGNANFDAVFDRLGRLGYSGNYILQTARAADGDDLRAAISYRDQVLGWIEAWGGGLWS